MAQQTSIDKPKAKRLRWWQLSLRTSLVFILLISLPLAWYANEVAGRKSEDDLADAIMEAGGHAYRSPVDRFNPPPHSPDPFGESSWTQAYRITNVELTADTPAKFRALLARVKRLQYLGELNLSDTCATDADLPAIERLAKLTVLDLSGTNVSDEGVAALVRLTNLEKLNLSFTDITDSGLKQLARLGRLRKIDVTGTQVTDDGFITLCRERPEVLVNWNGPLSAREVLAARGLRRSGWRVEVGDTESVGRVSVAYPKRSEELSSVELTCLERLSNLDLTIGEQGSSRIRQILPQLQGLRVLQSTGGIDGIVLGRLKHCQNLHRLLLWEVLSDNDLAALGYFPQLEALQMNADSLSSRGIAHISQAKNLAFVGLSRGHFINRDLESLKNLPNLEELHLRMARFEPGSTQPLGGLKKLKILDLCGSNIDHAGMLSLLSLPALEELNVGETRISDKGLLELAKIKSLKRMNVKWLLKGVTDEGRKRFCELRPDVVFDAE